MALYQVGLKRDCPFSVVHLAGHEFPIRTQKISGYGPDQRVTDLDGVVLELSPAEVAAIKKAAARKVILGGIGKKGRAILLDSADRRYRKRYRVPDGEPYAAGHRPVASWVYLRPVATDPALDGVEGGNELPTLDGADARAASEADELAALRAKVAELEAELSKKKGPQKTKAGA